MRSLKLSKHDMYVLELKNKIKDNYDSISVNVPVKHSKRSLGEIDIIAKKGNRFDLYEVKCSYRILKAKKQLSRVKKYLNLKNAGNNSKIINARAEIRTRVRAFLQVGFMPAKASTDLAVVGKALS